MRNQFQYKLKWTMNPKLYLWIELQIAANGGYVILSKYQYIETNLDCFALLWKTVRFPRHLSLPKQFWLLALLKTFKRQKTSYIKNLLACCNGSCAFKAGHCLRCVSIGKGQRRTQFVALDSCKARALLPFRHSHHGHHLHSWTVLFQGLLRF